MVQDKTKVLVQLAREEFGTLTPAEEKLFHAVANGEGIKYSFNDPEKDNPANADNWPAGRVLQADRISWLCTDPKASKLVTHRGICVEGARIDGVLNLVFVRLPFRLNFEKCAFSKEINLRQSRILALGLEGSRTRTILADGLQTESIVHLGGGFRAEGEVRLLGASIGGDLICRRGEFIGNESNVNGTDEKRVLALSADRASVKGNIYLDEYFQAKGEVRLPGATIGGSLYCVNGQFMNECGPSLLADGVEVKGNVFLTKDFRADGLVSFGLSKVEGSFAWTGINSPQLAILNLSLARIGTLCDDQKSWPEKGNLFLHGLVYEQLDDRAPTDAKSRIEWLHRQSKDKFRPQPYEQLAAVLRKSGHDADAKKILIQKNKDEVKFGNLSFFGRLWCRFLGFTIAYGYRPAQALIFVLLFLVLGSVFFRSGYSADLITAPSESAYVQKYQTTDRKRTPLGVELSEIYPKFNFVAYSIDSFVPLVDLYQTNYWLPNAERGGLLAVGPFCFRTGELLRLYFWIHTASGWIFTTLLVVGLTGLVRR